MKSISSKYVIFVVFLVALFGVLLYYQYVTKDEELSSEEILSNKVVPAVKSGDLDTAVTASESILTEPLSREMDLSAKYALSSSKWYRNEGDDRKEAAKIFKVLIEDDELPKLSRSNLVVLFESLLQAQLDDDFLKNYVFNDGIFAGFLADGKGDLGKATINLLEYADELYPSFLTKTHLAWADAQKVLDKNVTNKSEEMFYKEQFGKLLKEIDTLAVQPPTLSDFEGNYMAFSDFYFRLAAVYGAESLLNNNSEAFKTSEKYFKQSFAILEEAKQKKMSHYEYAPSSEIIYRIGYAAFTANFLGNSSADKVRAILAPIVNYKEDPYTKLALDGVKALALYGKTHPNSFLYKNALILADMDPDFKTFLTENGWFK